MINTMTYKAMIIFEGNTNNDASPQRLCQVLEKLGIDHVWQWSTDGAVILKFSIKEIEADILKERVKDLEEQVKGLKK